MKNCYNNLKVVFMHFLSVAKAFFDVCLVFVFLPGTFLMSGIVFPVNILKKS